MEAMSQGLAGLAVVDLGRGMAPAVATHLLAGMGAGVRRFEPSAGDPFHAVHPAYAIWHERADTAAVADLADPAIDAALAGADVCIVGGEDFPGYDWAPDATAIAARFPHLVILEIEGYPSDGDASDRPGVELLVQARSGLCFEQSNRQPIHLSFSPGNYAAAIHGLVAMAAALCQRERDGTGQIVRTSLFEGAMTLTGQYWVAGTAPSGSFNFTLPKDPHPLIFKCRDGRYIHFVLGSFGSKGHIYRILEIDDPTVKPEDSGLPKGDGDPKNFFGDIDTLAAHVIRFDSGPLMEQILAAGVAANFVLAPGECWDDVQVRHIGIIGGTNDGGRKVGLPIRGDLAPHDPARRLTPAVPAGSAPLAGLRVLDFGIFVAGPYGTVSLADLGADVIKIETPQGDPNRGIFRPYAAVNRGKRAIAIDMKTPDGMEITRRLAASAHILHNNYRPGVSRRLGVDPKSQHAIDPAKIVLESTGCGRSGPHGDRAGFDMIFQAFCGHEIRAGGVGNMPMWDRTSMVDYFVGLINGLATMVATWRRFRGADGADMELCLLDAGLFLMSELVQARDGSFGGAPLLNHHRTGYHPAEALYQCADGWIAIAARSDAMAAALATTLDVEAGARAAWGETEYDAIAAALLPLPVADAIIRLEAEGIWVEHAHRDGARFIDRDSPAPGLVVTNPHPVYGDVRQIGALFRLNGGRRTSAPRGAPVLGEHTREILAEMGYDEDEIASLYERRVVA